MKKLSPKEHKKKYPDDYIGNLRLKMLRCTNPNCKRHRFLGFFYLERGALKIKCPSCGYWVIVCEGVDDLI